MKSIKLLEYYQLSDDELNTKLKRLNGVVEKFTKPIEEYDYWFKKYQQGNIDGNPIVSDSMALSKQDQYGMATCMKIREHHFIITAEDRARRDAGNQISYVLTKEGARVAFTEKMELFVRHKRRIELILRGRKKEKEKTENVGYVYVLSNKSLPPNTYKIGSTYKLPEERAEQLSGTAHLTPFKVAAKIKIQSAEYYEKSIHELLKDYRVKEGREFFKLDLKKIKDCLKQVSELSDKGKEKLTLSDLKKRIKI